MHTTSAHTEQCPLHATAFAKVRSLSEILDVVPNLATEISRNAAQREAERQAPFEAFELLRRAGIGTLRIGVEQHGPGGSIVDVITVIMSIAAADSNVAHSLRSHFNTTELLRLDPNPSAQTQQQIRQVLQGALFGGAFTERGTARAGMNTTTLQQVNGHYELNGKKYYATGTAYADYVNVFAVDEQQQGVTVTIPVHRQGVDILDDWDGMGQRLTASGSVVLDHVQVFPHEISYVSHHHLHARHASAFRQLFLVATAAGIMRNILSDALHFVRHIGRPAMHGTADQLADDHLVQSVVGDLAAKSFAIDQLVLQNAQQLDLGAQAIVQAHSKASDIVLEGALHTAKTQLIVSQLALPAAERLFEVGGASATSKKLNLDRHWRNLRTIFSHNPLLHKARVVGDYELNGNKQYLEEGRVF